MIAFGKTRNKIRANQNDPAFSPSSMIGDSFYEYQADLTAKHLGASYGLSGAKLRDKINTLIYRGWESLFKKIKPFKYAVETLAALKQAGYKMGLLSDFPPEIKLEYLGIAGFWDVILCSELCGALKPHPKSFIDLAKAMSLPAEKIIYVGNSRPYDVAGAAAAGMKTAWIKNPLFPGRGLLKPKADFCFSNYRQLYNFMLK